MRFRLIDAAKKDFPVQRLCKVLDVSASGYVAWKERPACRRQRADMVLLAHVRSAFTLSNGTYGSPRMVHELRHNGLSIGRRRVARLMRENGLRARQKRRFKRTTDSLHAFPIAPNLLDQDFAAARPNQKWGADISYVRTREGWLYLAVVIDLFARRVVGWATSDRLHKDWPCRLCAGPSPCGVLPPASFTRGPRQPILLPRLPGRAEEERHRDLDVGKGKLLR
jgi:putative transposase